MSTRPHSGVPAAAQQQEEHVLLLGDLLRGLWRRLWLILLVPLALAGTVALLSSLASPTYMASSTVLVVKDQDEMDDNSPIDLQSDAQDIQALVPTVTQSIDSLPVAREVARRLDFKRSPKKILDGLTVVQTVAGSQFLEITYVDTDAAVAQRVTNTAATVASERFSEISPSLSGANITSWAEASVPQATTANNLLRYSISALVVGGVLSVGLALLLALLDDRLRSRQRIEQASGVPTFGVIPEMGQRPRTKGAGPREAIAVAAGFGRETAPVGDALEGLSERLVMVTDPTGSAAEAYRALRTNLLFAPANGSPKVVVVSSPGPGEGKSVTCANLAVALAQTGKDTLVIDCNLRNPAMRDVFGLRETAGLVDILTGELGLSEAWQEPVPGLKLVTAGSVPPDPAELLSSGHFTEVVGQARERFDHVLLDSPDTDSVSDSVLLSARADGVLLVMDVRKTRKGSMLRAARDLEMVGGKIIGTVVNGVKSDSSDKG